MNTNSKEIDKLVEALENNGGGNDVWLARRRPGAQSRFDTPLFRQSALGLCGYGARQKSWMKGG